MPFGYYARLNKKQQAIYRQSDAVTEVRLPRPRDLDPLVAELGAALQSEVRARTQRATEELIRGLTDALEIPPVRVDVLAARPHARWGELHGLYTSDGRRPPKIQLWMRTAKQRRVVAFRTFLRTLLHEVGHHIDYTKLGLADSFHTEGFYKRESSLFHQLVPTPATERHASSVRSPEEYAALPLADRLARLERTRTELARLLRGRSEAVVAQRPASDAWAAGEVVCHLRDAEEHLARWMQMILSMDEPVLVQPSTADRWAEDRQYRRHHVGAAWDAFSRRRDETLALLRDVPPDAWRRAGRHRRRGKLRLDDLLNLMAWHDDNHLDQITRALDGRA
ncbi:MAG: hypothetical protein DMD81_16345 [Candidatus Rokuibacteriota bacterium]|nr:MAG: hypothetical protein DMD81_16345 [Candidatus Rokubacteria bacterium]